MFKVMFILSFHTMIAVIMFAIQQICLPVKRFIDLDWDTKNKVIEKWKLVF